MSLNDIKTNIEFGASLAVSKEMIEQSNGDALEWKKERTAAELGVRIAKEKGWLDQDDGDMVLSNLRLYVFTTPELMDYMEAKFKSRLRQMAVTEEYLTDEQRQALMLQAERF